MKVLIYEPAGGTHFYQHVSVIARAVSDLGCEAIVSLSTVAPQIAGYDEFIAPLSDVPRVTVRLSNPPLSSVPVLRSPRYRLKWLNEAIKQHRPDHVLITYGDGLMHEVGTRRFTLRTALPPGVDAEVLFFKGRIAYTFEGAPWREWMDIKLKWKLVNAGQWTRKFHIDPFVVEMQRRQGIPDRLRFHAMPEPLEPVTHLSRIEARRFLNLEETGRWIALPGGVDERKGADLLLWGFRRAPLGPTDRLLLVGKVDSVLKKLIETDFADLVRSGQLVVRDGFVSDEVLLASFRAADVVAAPHRSCFQSSGIVTRAAVAGTLMVGTQLGWIGNMLRMFSLGEACDTFDAQTFGDAIRRSLDRAAAYVPGEGVRRLAEFHTIANFQATWMENIRAKLGLPALSERRTWSWVVEAATDSGTSAEVHAANRAR